jgi:hypothetical protein
MPRIAKTNVQQMDDEVIKCFVHPNTGKEVTTPAERQEIAERWCAGDFEHHHTIAALHGLLPIALIIAALIDIEHPLLVSARGVLYNSLQCSMVILQVMKDRQSVAQPIAAHSFHSQPVERMK